MRSFSGPHRRIVLLVTLAAALCAVAERLNPVKPGLTATYYSDSAWRRPVVTRRDVRPSSDAFLAAWVGTVPETFSVRWSGGLLVPRSATYTFATVSDDGSRVFVDGRLVVDNGGRHGAARRDGEVRLDSGVHQLTIDYAQEGGFFEFTLLASRGGQPVDELPRWALMSRHVSLARSIASVALHRATAAVEWLWACTILIWVGAAFFTAGLPAREWFVREGVWPALPAIIAGSVVINVAGIWWGLPGAAWAPDEWTPDLVMAAAAQKFSHGSFARYPPFHYFLLAVSYSPALLMQALGRIDLAGELEVALLMLTGRLVSVAAAAGTLVALYLSGARLFGPRPGLFAAAMFALLAPFVYYAKTANLDVPYMFWFAVSFFFYLRALESFAARDLVACAVAAALATCTKDQAYALFIVMPIVIVVELARRHRAAGRQDAIRAAVLDRRLWIAGGAGALAFLVGDNVLLNWSAFAAHVRLLASISGSATYEMVEATMAGRLTLLGITLDIIRAAWGWPLFIVAVAGVGVALRDPRLRRRAAHVAMPGVVYYLGFINLGRYNYDRFMLPICFLLAIFGGLALSRWLARDAPFRRARAAAAAAIFVYTAFYAVNVDVAMIHDSRYEVERWLTSHAGRGDLIGFVFPRAYNPRFGEVRSVVIDSIGRLEAVKPRFYVLNAEYARAVPPTSDVGRLVSGLQEGHVGYRLAFRFRQPPTWPWLPGAHRDLVGDRTEHYVSSSLRHINPTFEVYERK